jgi:diguanylate cyclase (GGDEF)-like protein/PAS domain S-box-containing protein
VENVNDSIVITQKDKFIFFNPRFAEMLGYKTEELLMKDYREVYTPKSVQVLLEREKRRMRGEDVPARYETFFRKKDGSEISVEANVTIINYKGELATFGVIRDITERKQAEQELTLVHQIYRNAIENAQGVPYRLNYADNAYEFMGEGVKELLGIPSEELTFEKLRNVTKEIIVIDPKAPRDPYEYGRAFKRGEVIRYRVDLRIVTPSGVEKWLSDCSIPIRDEKTGQVTGSLGILQDVTDRKQAEEELRALSRVDELTGLYNRRGFLTIAQQQLKAADRMKRNMLLLFIDFDSLKRINDSLGHPEGDLALAETASVLKKTFRESDILARIGGDEFAVLAVGASEEDTDIVIARLKANLKTQNAKEGRRYRLSISIGSARYRAEFPSSLEKLMAEADALMLERKRGKKKS